MAVPTYTCPFKAKSQSDAGLVCENTACGAYDTTNEECIIIQYMSSDKMKAYWLAVTPINDI